MAAAAKMKGMATSAARDTFEEMKALLQKRSWRRREASAMQ
jgi:hypothetical protein